MEERSFKRELTARWTMTETVRASIIGAVFFGLIMALAPLSFGPLQFRVADTLDLLPFDRKYGGRAAVVGILVGGGLTNFFSPYGPAEVLGTLSGICVFTLTWWLGIKTRGTDWGKQIACTANVIITDFFIAYLMLHVLFQAPLREVLITVTIEMIIIANVLSFALVKALERTYVRKGINVSH